MSEETDIVESLRETENNVSEKDFVLPSKREWKRVFNYKWIVQNVPFFLFLGALAIVYIYNGHLSDKLVRKIAVSEKNLKEMEYEYKTLKSEVIFRSKASELVKAVEPLGLKESLHPPLVLGLDSLKQDSAQPEAHLNGN